MNPINPTCPCKRFKCERHGNCIECKQHHQTQQKNVLPTCERLAEKEKQKSSRTK